MLFLLNYLMVSYHNCMPCYDFFLKFLPFGKVILWLFFMKCAQSNYTHTSWLLKGTVKGNTSGSRRLSCSLTVFAVKFHITVSPVSATQIALFLRCLNYFSNRQPIAPLVETFLYIDQGTHHHLIVVVMLV